MSKFTTPLIVKLVGKNLWEVYEPFEYHVGSYPSDEIISVPAGTITNFASVPRIFWSIISPVDTHGKAAVLHDYSYEIHYDSRKRCDKIFAEAMEVLGVEKYKIDIIYQMTRTFGWNTWRKTGNKIKEK
jgi:hypothetical protein